MKGHKNGLDRLKNIIIVVLLFSAVVLGWESRLFGNASVNLSALTNPGGGKAEGSGSGEQAAGIKTVGQAMPVSIAVTDGTGTHHGAKYDLNDIDSIYENTVLIFLEALGTAQTPEKTDETAWRGALRAPGVFFEYMSPIRLSLLDGWFETEIKGEWRNMSVRRLCVAVDGKPRLYFQEEKTGDFYAADTAVLPEHIAKLTNLFTPNTASFAFETLTAPSLNKPYTLIMPDMDGHPRLEAKNPLTSETLAEVLRRLGVSEHLKPITDEDGNEIYIQPEDFRIELSPDGTVRYRRTGSPEASPGFTDESGAVELARQVVAESIGKYCGEAARIYFDAVRSAGTDSYEVFFTYVAAGGRVYLGPDGYAASVTVSDGAVSKMELRFRSFAISGAGSGLIPEIQAAAASGGAYMLCYADKADGVMEPSWVDLVNNS